MLTVGLIAWRTNMIQSDQVALEDEQRVGDWWATSAEFETQCDVACIA